MAQPLFFSSHLLVWYTAFSGNLCPVLLFYTESSFMSIKISGNPTSQIIYCASNQNFFLTYEKYSSNFKIKLEMKLYL